jgi:hypothetical protein
LSPYSNTFTPRKTLPSAMVRMRKSTIRRRWPSAAARTASAMVRLLPMSTAVLRPPSFQSR